MRQWEGGFCERCEASRERFDWLDATCEAVEKLASENDWEHDGWHVAGTGSRYTTLTRECGNCILGGGACTCETLKVRVSDHGSCYCSEDVSIAKTPSGDDHSLAILANRLIR